MKVYELVAAAVLRVGSDDMRALSWTELGEVFNVTKDVARHQLNRFKEKYNVVDADVVEDGWNSAFLKEHTPDSEKAESKGSFTPGDLLWRQPEEDVLTVVIRPDGTAVYRDANGKVQATVHAGGSDNADVFPTDQQEDEGDLNPNPGDPVVQVAKVQVEELKHLITPNVLVVVRDGNPLTIDKSHKNFSKIQAALESKEWQKVLDLIDLKTALSNYSNGRVLVENGRVTLDGERVNGKVAERLVSSLVEENMGCLTALTAFIANADDNPDFRVVSRLYDFISHNDIRIDQEGYLLCYKVVRHNYLDKHSGTMDNSPGKLVQMKRNKVNPKDEETCSHGLHVAAKSYIPQFGTPSLNVGGDRVLLCRVNPKDFVSIPTDYNNTKARVCEYKVLKDVTELFVKGQETDDGVSA